MFFNMFTNSLICNVSIENLGVAEDYTSLGYYGVILFLSYAFTKTKQE